MANLQVKNISASLHQQLRRCAKRRKSTLSEVVLETIKRELARSMFHDQLAKRLPVEFGVSAASLLEEERHQHNQEIQ